MIARLLRPSDRPIVPPKPAMHAFTGKLFRVGLLGMMITTSTHAVSTPGSVDLSATINDLTAKSGSAHDAVVWVTHSSGTFIKTLWKQGDTSTMSATGGDWDHFTTWNTARNGSIAFDGYSSATASSYTATNPSPPTDGTKAGNPIHVIWNCRDASNAIVPDGTYHFYIQYAENITSPTKNGPASSALTWTKGPTAATTNPANQGTQSTPTGGYNFTNISILWTPITPFKIWSDAAGLPAGQNGPGDSPQGDGVSNLEKFAFNMNPGLPDVRRLIVGSNGNAGLPGGAMANGGLRVEFLRRKTSSNPGITYTLQFSSNIGAWTDCTGSPTSVTSIDSTWERIVIDDPVRGFPSRFARVTISQP